MFTIVDGDLFDAPETYLCHQCNCVTKGAAHLAAAVFKRFPYADIYSPRTEPDEPGTIILRGNGEYERFVVNMLGQFYPGRSSVPTGYDSYKIRRRYFRESLFKMTELEGNFAFPWGIGCGAAGGDWGKYIEILKNFESYIKGNVVIYKLPEVK